jgi:hypothetical protein
LASLIYYEILVLAIVINKYFFVESNIICPQTYTLTNDAFELTPYKFEFKSETDTISNFLSMQKFESRSQRRMTDALANYNTSPLSVFYTIKMFVIYYRAQKKQILYISLFQKLK